MPLFKLSAGQIKQFAGRPETAMGLHVVRLSSEALRNIYGRDWEEHGQSAFAFVIDDQVLMTDDEQTVREINGLIEPEGQTASGGESWLAPGPMWHPTDIEEAFEGWRDALRDAPRDLEPVERDEFAELAMLRLPPASTPPPSPPIPPKLLYGHLPFTTTIRKADVFYRYESFPTSKRIVRASPPVDKVGREIPDTIAAGTYACPASEAPFVPSGFAAVGRFALPNLMPACFRHELQPLPGATIRCGACVPLYGQAGGGVEVCFTAQTNNRGRIANPIIIRAL